MNDVLGVAARVVGGPTAGWIAGVTIKTGGYGRAGDVAIGSVGAFAGAWLFRFVTPADMTNELGWTIACAALGATAFVAIARLVTRRPRRGSAGPDPGPSPPGQETSRHGGSTSSSA